MPLGSSVSIASASRSAGCWRSGTCGAACAESSVWSLRTRQRTCRWQCEVSRACARSCRRRFAGRWMKATGGATSTARVRAGASHLLPARCVSPRAMAAGVAAMGASMMGNPVYLEMWATNELTPVGNSRTGMARRSWRRFPFQRSSPADAMARSCPIARRRSATAPPTVRWSCSSRVPLAARRAARRVSRRRLRVPR